MKTRTTNSTLYENLREKVINRLDYNWLNRSKMLQTNEGHSIFIVNTK
jgi:hypothetical protein